MPTITLDRPDGEINTAQLRDELAAALAIPAPYVDLPEDTSIVEVVGEVDGSMEADAQAVLDSHTPADPEPTLADRLAEVERRLDNAPSAADLDELKNQLGGTK